MAFFRKVRSAIQIASERGVGELTAEVAFRVRRRFLTASHRQQLQKILAENGGKIRFVFHPSFEWNMQLRQRPQHMAVHLAKAGVLYFYCTPNGRRDRVSGFVEIQPGLFLTDRYDLLRDLAGKTVHHFYATSLSLDWGSMRRPLERGSKVIYEYVDEISELIAQREISTLIRERHTQALSDERVLVLATARRLLDEVAQKRSNGVILSPNAADYGHFCRTSEDPIANEMSKLKQKGGITIGYFGALAHWVDYELVRKIAREVEGVRVVLIGQDYDGSLRSAGLETFENIHVLKPVDYESLPAFARAFDVSIIPFLVNDVTLATSPIKVFEYMALGTPIVTTDLPECRSYESVLTASTHKGFISQLRKAIVLRNDPNYLELLRKNALENTWSERARAVLEFVQSRESKRSFISESPLS